MELLKCNFAAIVEKLRISPIIFLYTLHDNCQWSGMFFVVNYFVECLLWANLSKQSFFF